MSLCPPWVRVPKPRSFCDGTEKTEAATSRKAWKTSNQRTNDLGRPHAPDHLAVSQVVAKEIRHIHPLLFQRLDDRQLDRHGNSGVRPDSSDRRRASQTKVSANPAFPQALPRRSANRIRSFNSDPARCMFVVQLIINVGIRTGFELARWAIVDRVSHDVF